MSSCYFVTADLSFRTSRRAAAVALRRLMTTSEGVDFCLNEFACCGVRTRRFDDLMRIFLAGWPDLPFVVSRAHDHARYDNRFHASYGWERVLLRMFAALAPHLKDGSSLLIDCDDGINECVVKDGHLLPT